MNSDIFRLVGMTVRVTCQTVQIYPSNILKYLHSRQKKAATCEGKLIVEECLQSLQSFKEYKSPSNDGLAVEFCNTFWGILGYFS